MRSAIYLIRSYQRYLSRYLMPACRFYPSCSEYLCQAIKKYGVLKGLKIGFKRLMHCHPFSLGGYDPLF